MVISRILLKIKMRSQSQTNYAKVGMRSYSRSKGHLSTVEVEEVRGYVEGTGRNGKRPQKKKVSNVNRE